MTTIQNWVLCSDVVILNVQASGRINGTFVSVECRFHIRLIKAVLTVIHRILPPCLHDQLKYEVAPREFFLKKEWREQMVYKAAPIQISFVVTIVLFNSGSMATDDHYGSLGKIQKTSRSYKCRLPPAEIIEMMIGSSMRWLQLFIGGF